MAVTRRRGRPHAVSQTDTIEGNQQLSPGKKRASYTQKAFVRSKSLLSETSEQSEQTDEDYMTYSAPSLTSKLRPAIKSAHSLPSYMHQPRRRVTISTRETVIGEKTGKKRPRGVRSRNPDISDSSSDSDDEDYYYYYYYYKPAKSKKRKTQRRRRRQPSRRRRSRTRRSNSRTRRRRRQRRSSSRMMTMTHSRRRSRSSRIR